MEYSGFFNGDEEYGQDEFNRYFDNLYESGIAVNKDNSLQYEVAAGDRQVSVGTGFSILRGFYHYNDSAKVLPLTPDANLPKIYRVVIQLDIAQGKSQLMARAGTAASSPKPPELKRNTTVYEISLGQYRVNTNGAVNLVKDERTDVSVCGVIRPKNLNEYTAAMKEYQRRFEEWFAAQQGKGWRNIYVQGNMPEGAVDGSIWIEG
ncbi:MAG: hypothetical protein Q4C97_11700 [Bacillota bacterium]|nr:hypothetical protein [Bacillota bacterium]